MQVLDFAIFCELVGDIFFRRFFMYARHQHNPSFNRCESVEAGPCQSRPENDHLQCLHRAARVSDPWLDSTRSKVCSDATPLSFPPRFLYELQINYYNDRDLPAEL